MIEVKHSSIIIHNYELGDSGKLERILSVWDQVTFSYSWMSFIYDDENKTLTLPRGFDLDYLAYIFPDKEIQINNKSDESKVAIFNTKIEPRNNEQLLAIDFLLGQGRFKYNLGHSQKMLCLKTGEGKTYCTINALSKIRKRVMVIVDQDKIMQQWKNEFLKFTNLNDKEIYLIQGSDTIKKIMKEKQDLPYKVYLASHRTLASYSEDDWSKLSKFFNKIKIGVKVFDEAHVEFKNIFMVDSYTNTALTFYLTATPGRSNPVEDKVYQNSFKGVCKYGEDKKFDEVYHKLCYISYNSKPDMFNVAQCSNRYGFDINTFSDYTFNNKNVYKQFFDIIKSLLDMTIKKKGKTAIIVHKIDHVKKLAEDLQKLYPKIEIGLLCGSGKNKKDPMVEMEKKLIIATDKALGKAVDVKMLRFLIMTVPISSKIMAEQTLGRLRQLDNLDSFYFDLTDTGFQACVNQCRNRRNILDKKASSIKILKL